MRRKAWRRMRRDFFHIPYRTLITVTSKSCSRIRNCIHIFFYYWHTKLKIWTRNGMNMLSSSQSQKKNEAHVSRYSALYYFLALFRRCNLCFLIIFFFVTFLSFYFRAVSNNVTLNRMYGAIAMQYSCILPLVFHIHRKKSSCSLCLITIWECATLTSWASYNKGENNSQKTRAEKKNIVLFVANFSKHHSVPNAKHTYTYSCECGKVYVLERWFAQYISLGYFVFHNWQNIT